MDHSNHGNKRFPVPSAIAYAKASHILSRYRPIAPKPAPPRTDADLQSSSSAVNDRCSKTSTSSEYSKRRRRSRKRVSEPGTSSKNIKMKSSAEVGCDQNVTASVFSSKQVDDAFVSHVGVEARALLGLAVSDARGDNQCAPDCNVDGGSPSLKRAARLFPGVVLSEAGETRKLQDCGRGGIALASSASESSSVVCNFGSTTWSAHGDDSIQQLLPSPQSAEGSATCIASTSTRKNLVTLSLLPDTPLRECTSSSAASHPTTNPMSSFLRRKMPWDDNSDNNMVQLSLSPSYGSIEQNCIQVLASDSVAVQRTGASNVMDADGGVSFHTAWSQFATRNGGNPPLIDSSYLEQTYVASSDPVMLTDEHYEILWSNLSFRKSIAERMSRRYQERGAYIDDLGVPTALASFIFLKPDATTLQCRAILWGFLKKMVFPKPSMMHIGPSVSEGGNVQECRPFPYVPQPVRPIGSTICLECITEVNTLFPLPKTLDIAKEQMEQSSLPRLISDTNNHVLWVNSAYKKMVGQHQKQDRLVEFGVREHVNTSASPFTKDVALVFLNDQPPADATSFSGRVRLHWFNLANSRSITAPCQVKRMHDKDNGELLLWTFHVSPLDRMRDGLGLRDGDLHSRLSGL